jgi:hypothetical protein
MAERQIYVMITKPFCRRCKVGISYNSHKRDREVTKSTGKNMGLLIVLPFMFAYFLGATYPWSFVLGCISGER